MEEILLELKILKKVLTDSNESLKFRLEGTTSDVDLDYLSEEVTFGRLIFAITRGLQQSRLLEMTDEELLKHIQKVQILEKD